MFIAKIIKGQLIEKNVTFNFNSLGAKEGLTKCLKKGQKMKKILYLFETNLKVLHMFLYAFFKGFSKI